MLRVLRKPADAASIGGIRDIDALCGVAILFILAQHAAVATTRPPAYDSWAGTDYVAFWSGYDVLFAVLGYVGARALIPRLAAARSLGAKSRIAAAFWLHCAWRLLPSMWLWLAVTVICTIAFNRFGVFGASAPLLGSALASAFSMENLRVAWFGRGSSLDPITAYWAVSLAMQCCLALPLIVALFRTRLAAVIPVAILLQLVLTRTAGTPASYVRSDALLLGVLIAAWTGDPTYRLFEPAGLARWRVGQIIVPMFLFVLLAASSSEQLHLVPFRGGIVAVLSAVLVWLASYGRSYILPDGFIAKRILAWIGARALPFYLVHIPAFLAAREIWFRLDPSALHAEPPHHVRFIATALVLAGACAELTHRLIEAPLQRIEPRIYPNPATATPNSPHAVTSTEPAPLLADR